MKKSELFTQEMLESFVCHPYAEAPDYNGKGVVLSDVYRSYSDAKECAYNDCSKLCDQFNGWGFHIASSNSMVFTVKFKFENPLNGRTMLAHITRDHKHLYFA